MTDAEINEAVARKLGHSEEELKIWGKDSAYDYCHSIGAAWEIVEHLASLKDLQGFSLHTPEYSGPHTKYHFRIIARTVYEETANTAPMAICLAFLRI